MTEKEAIVRLLDILKEKKIIGKIEEKWVLRALHREKVRVKK